jgi:hypothetical protein
VDTANVLRSYGRPELSSFRDYYRINPELVPNWFGHVFLAGASYLVPAVTAEKLFLSSYLVLLPVSVRWALGTVAAAGPAWAGLTFPFVGNVLLHMGFYNFVSGLPVFFLVVGTWLRRRESWSLGETVGFGLLWLLLYFCHLVPFLLACVAVAVLAVWLTLFDALRQIRGHELDLRALVHAWWRRALVPLYCSLPGLLLAYEFVIRNPPQGAGASSMDRQWCRLRDLRALVSYSAAEVWPARGVFWLFAGLVLAALIRKILRRSVERADGLLVLAGVYLLLYFQAEALAPQKMLSPRLMLFPFFALILWLGAQELSRRLAGLALGAAAGLAVLQLGLHSAKYAQLNDYLDEYLSGMELVEPNTTVLALCFSHQGTAPDGRRLSEGVEAFRHASGYLAAQRHAVDLLNFEAGMNPALLLYRPERNPYRLLLRGEHLEAEPPDADFLGYARRSGGRVDYVLLWNLDPSQAPDRVTRSILGQLRIGYEKIHTSPQRGLMHLYRRKAWTQEEDPK